MISANYNEQCSRKNDIKVIYYIQDTYFKNGLEKSVTSIWGY